MNRINILQDMPNRANGKPLFFVNRTKRAMIPGTIAGNPNEQAVGLSITALEQRFHSVLLSDLTSHPDEALDQVQDLARA